MESHLLDNARTLFGIRKDMLRLAPDTPECRRRSFSGANGGSLDRARSHSKKFRRLAVSVVEWCCPYAFRVPYAIPRNANSSSTCLINGCGGFNVNGLSLPGTYLVRVPFGMCATAGSFGFTASIFGVFERKQKHLPSTRAGRVKWQVPRSRLCENDPLEGQTFPLQSSPTSPLKRTRTNRIPRVQVFFCGPYYTANRGKKQNVL
jgi:hypothetical protein